MPRCGLATRAGSALGAVNWFAEKVVPSWSPPDPDERFVAAGYTASGNALIVVRPFGAEITVEGTTLIGYRERPATGERTVYLQVEAEGC